MEAERRQACFKVRKAVAKLVVRGPRYARRLIEFRAQSTEHSPLVSFPVVHLILRSRIWHDGDIVSG